MQPDILRFAQNDNLEGFFRSSAAILASLGRTLFGPGRVTGTAPVLEPGQDLSR